MTYLNCKKIILNKIKILTDEEYKNFSLEMKNKLDIFLLNERLTNNEYNELIKLIDKKEI